MTAPTMRTRIVVALALAIAFAATACGRAPADPVTAPAPGNAVHSHAAYVPPSPAPLRSGERFVTLSMPEAYTPVAPNGGTDEYRCFLVDPGLSKTAYLTGSQFLPQNAAVVHHAIFFRVDRSGVTKALAADARDPGQGWRCFGNAGIDDDNDWVSQWAPGSNEVLLAPGLGFALPPGSRLVMQVHYNLLAGGGADRSGIRLRLNDGSVPMTPLRTFLLAAPVELPCTPQESGKLCDRDAAIADVTHRFGRAAGARPDGLARDCGRLTPGPTQFCDHTAEGPATLYAAAGHMHLLGRAIKIEINPGTPTARTVLDVPQYVFDNQAITPLRTPIRVKRGDVLRVTCTHDARLRQMLPALKQQPPRYVVWGDGTADEMCLGVLVGVAG